MEWVVRAGAATAQRLIEGYAQHKGAPGLYGFSVQYAPGATIEQLAQAGRFPHAPVAPPTTRCKLRWRRWDTSCDW